MDNQTIIIDNKQFKILKYSDIDTDYKEKLELLSNDLCDINEINNQINTMLVAQGENLKQSQRHIESTVETTINANNELTIASEYQKSYFWKKNLFVSICTTIVVAPVAILAGAKCAVIAGVGIAGMSLYNLS
ncbi:hypothetical protein BMW23_0268 [Bodo saltans virus]|uniref:t-SNARE coiled-coil homology domain-containing protein n=1 Tax=Bodo saltans virus TaxID=2024608 RepID=A0A2H4UTY9_9VIRU|nr:hypothetical protein QJ851_gp0263 [Bodo saltans virus]ATZ80326.1 hypothetical protein BMW23_0268 [Bodo saltans virus]